MSDEPTRKGKIARLPASIRDEVCRRMHDGQTASQIIPWLHTLPEVLKVLDTHFGEEPISPQNLSEWRGGGYQDWIQKRERVENMKSLSSYAFEMAKAGGSVSDGAAAVAGGKILEMLEDADEKTIEGLALSIAKLRDADAKLVRAQVAVRNADQKNEQLQLDKLKFQRTTAEMFLKWAKSPEALAIIGGGETKTVQMEKLVQLMFGERPSEGRANE